MIKILDLDTNSRKLGIKVNGIYEAVQTETDYIIAVNNKVIELKKEDCTADFVINCTLDGKDVLLINPMINQPLGFLTEDKQFKCSGSKVKDVWKRDNKLYVQTENDKFKFRL